MPDQNQTTTPDTESTFVCDCEKWNRSACQGEPFFREHEDKRYCVLHYPDTDKLETFRAALKRKLDAKDFNLRAVWFPEDVNFENFEFSAEANFSCAIFNAVADFRGALFSADAKFTVTTFSADAYFKSVTFSAEADFFGAIFNASADFRGATFSADAYLFARFSADADFSGATFSADAYLSATFRANAKFYRTTFKSYVRFDISNKTNVFSRLDFQQTHIEKPERVSFHTLYLKPHWFINCDCRKFEFTDCDWNFKLKEDLKGASNPFIEAPHRLLAIAYRQLADNAEANHRYQEASKFRYNAFEARRIEKYWGFVPWRLDWWYWLASGYGERVARAFLVFIALFALFAFGYGVSGFDQSGKGTTASVAQGAAIQPDTVGKPLELRDAFIYSFYVTILQKPEPKPLTRTAKILVGLETVLGPAQAALLALAVRRRFMR